jgi:hypothetical protein
MLIHQLSYDKIVDFLFTARDRVVWATVNLFEEAADALTELRNSEVAVTIILDPTEEAYRNGFGDPVSIHKLAHAGCDIREASHNRVSFLIVDNQGYFLFNQSRILEAEAQGMNAVRMDALLCERMLLEYLPPANDTEAFPRLENIVELAMQAIEEVGQVPELIRQIVGKPGTPPLDMEKFEEVEQKLRVNPPLHPDLKRQMNVYTNKFQYVELEFEGANFEQIQLVIPKDVLPFKDVRLKKDVRAKLPLFENVEKFPISWSSIKQDLDELRKEFLVKSKKANKNIIAVSRKGEFREEVKNLQKRIKDAEKELLDFIKNDKIDTEERLHNELFEFFQNNPPDEGAFQNFVLGFDFGKLSLSSINASLLPFD